MELLILLGGSRGGSENACSERPAAALIEQALVAAGGKSALSRVQTEDLECEGVFHYPDGDRPYRSRIRFRASGEKRFDMSGGSLPGQLRVVITPRTAFASMDGLVAKEPDEKLVALARASPRTAAILNVLTRARRGDRARAWHECPFLSQVADVLELCDSAACEKYYLDPLTHTLIGVEDDESTVRLLDLRRVAGVLVPHRWRSWRKGSDATNEKSCRWRFNRPMDSRVFAR